MGNPWSFKRLSGKDDGYVKCHFQIAGFRSGQQSAIGDCMTVKVRDNFVSLNTTIPIEIINLKLYYLGNV